MPKGISRDPAATLAKRRASDSLPKPLPGRRLANGRLIKQTRIGRPSKYNPAFCDVAIDMGKLGCSPAEIASRCDVSLTTLSQWESEFPAFALALARARTHEQAWWAAKGRKSLGSKHFQANVWRMVMASRFRADYTESPKMAVGVSIDLSSLIRDSLSSSRGSARVIESTARKDDAKA